MRIHSLSNSPPAWRSRATQERERIGWEIAAWIEKILRTVLHEAHRRQVEEIMKTFGEGPESFYKSIRVEERKAGVLRGFGPTIVPRRLYR